MVGEGIAEEEETGLEHERQAFHDEVEMPGVHSVHLALSISTAVNDGPTLLYLGITVEPLFSQHGNECGKEGSGQTSVERSSNMDSIGARSGPLREGGSGTGQGVPKRDVGDNHEELIAHSLDIRLKTGLNGDDESGCDNGEQTSLSPGILINATIGVDGGKTLTKINVVSKSEPYLVKKSWSCLSASRWNLS